MTQLSQENPSLQTSLPAGSRSCSLPTPWCSHNPGSISEGLSIQLGTTIPSLPPSISAHQLPSLGKHLASASSPTDPKPECTDVLQQWHWHSTGIPGDWQLLKHQTQSLKISSWHCCPIPTEMIRLGLSCFYILEALDTIFTMHARAISMIFHQRQAHF